MDPSVRHALAEDVEDEINDSQEEWSRLEDELAEARERLRDSEAREKFLGMRLYKYQQKMREQARCLEQDERVILHRREGRANQLRDDPEHQAEDEVLLANWERRKTKWGQENDLLESIQGTHKQILVDCEMLRRTIRSLEIRCRHFQCMRRECTDFVVKAHELNDRPVTNEEHSRGEEDDSTPEMEMSHFISSTRPSKHDQPCANDILTRSYGAQDSETFPSHV
jgi:chromosome segregation ATPase